MNASPKDLFLDEYVPSETELLAAARSSKRGAFYPRCLRVPQGSGDHEALTVAATPGRQGIRAHRHHFLMPFLRHYRCPVAASHTSRRSPAW